MLDGEWRITTSVVICSDAVGALHVVKLSREK